MSTNSIIGLPTETGGFRGRYVHWDGYPEGVGEAVAAIVSRDGYTLAVKTLLSAHGWSQVTGDTEPADTRSGTVVPGYGVAYTPEGNRDEWFRNEGTETPNEWVSEGVAEWAYVITETTIEVWRYGVEGPWVRRPDLDMTVSQ